MDRRFFSIRTILLFILIVPTFCFANIPLLANQYSVKKLTAEDGFVSSEIYSIIQDQQGLLWFGTAENGVMRYDGRKVTLFEFDRENINGLSHNDAGNLMLDRNGDVWVGTWGGGANRYDPTTGQFENFIHDPKQASSISANRIQSLYHDLSDTIWLGSYDKGLNQYLGNQQFAHITKKEGLSHNRIWAIQNHDVHSLWVATSYGLNLYNTMTKSFRYFYPDPTNKTPTGANEIRHILKTTTGQLYIGTQQGPFLFDLDKEQFTPLGNVNGVHLGQVNSMMEDKNGYIWFVTSKGVFRQLNINSLALTQLDLEHNSGLRIIFEDNAKTIWVTNEVHGIYKLVPHRKFKSINSPELIAPNGIVADHKGDLLITTSSSEVFKWHVATRNLEKISPSIFNESDGFSENRLLERPVLHLENDTTLWIAQDEGLAKLNLSTRHKELLTYPTDDPNHHQFREIRALTVDKHGKLWIGTYKNGIYTYDPQSKRFMHLGPEFGLSHPEVLTIFKDKGQNIWVGTGDGVNLWVENNQTFRPFVSNKYQPDSLLGSIVQDIHQTRSGEIWIATQKGLNLYLPNTKTFKNFSTEHGLPSSLIRAIADDKEGNLWLTTNKGVTKFTPKNEQVINYDSQHGVLGLNYYPNSLTEGKNNTLFTSSQRGIEYFSTVPVQSYQYQPKLILTGFSKMGQPIKLDKPYSYVDEIHISYLDYIFSFEFSLLDFISPSKNQYAYKLVGYDDNWIEIGNRNTASFTNLDGGSYQFQVRATNSNGKWESNILSINLHVLPPPWHTWWAYCIYALIVVLSIFAVIYLRTKLQQVEIMRQKHFVQQLEEQVSDKTASLKKQATELELALEKAEEVTRLKSEFLANMSHEIRTPMNGVLGMLELLKNSNLSTDQAHSVDIARTSAHSLLTLINDILDFSKIEADKLELEYVDFDLRQLIEQLSESMALSAQEKGVNIVLDLVDIHTSFVNSDPGRLRQIITNILSNAIKFTEQGEITITAMLSQTQVENCYTFECQIKDTGIGIPKEKLPTLFDSFSQVDASTTRKYGGTGLGLSITKKLSLLLSGDVKVTSEVGVGSCFVITCLVSPSDTKIPSIPSLKTLHLNVLIVDTNLSSNKAVKRQLEQWDVTILEATTAKQALELVFSHDIHIILINRTLPDMSADSFAEKIKANSQFSHIKMVFMTQLHNQYEPRNNTLIDGAFTKPITRDNLLRSLSIARPSIASFLLNQHSGELEVNTVDTNQDEKVRTKILLVEDNKVNQLVAVKMLNNMHVIVDVAENGIEAIDKLKSAQKDDPYIMVLMDCQMPKMDGYETTRNIRASQAGNQHTRIPIIAMTANAMQGDKQKCLDAGMDDYITKPIEADKVLEKVKYWINQNRPNKVI